MVRHGVCALLLAFGTASFPVAPFTYRVWALADAALTTISPAKTAHFHFIVDMLPRRPCLVAPRAGGCAQSSHFLSDLCVARIRLSPPEFSAPEVYCPRYSRNCIGRAATP